MNKLYRFTILFLLLAILCFGFILYEGKAYTVVIDNYDFSDVDINDINTIQEGSSVTMVDKNIIDGKLELEYRSLKKGKSNIEIIHTDYYDYRVLYVNLFGIITEDNYFGDATGDEVIQISITILLFVLIIMIYDSYRRSVDKNLYQYKNMYYLGLIIFLIFLFIYNAFKIFSYKGLYDTFNSYIASYNVLSYLLLPIGVITFLFVSISNIILIKKEGFSYRNMLGILLGILLCLITIIPEFMYRFTYSEFLINIHNMSTIDYHVYTFAESFIYSFVCYLECILIAVIILSIKAARRIPSLDKDYIIVLGCMVNKDGTLTNLLKSRVDRAIEFKGMQKDKKLTFITSGGKGNDEPISEGLAMKNYLEKKGIKDVIVEDKSTTTYENFRNSFKLIKGKKNVAFSTTNYHVFRAGVEASSLGYDVEGIGAKTKRYFWINAFIREYIATLYYERKHHFKIFMLLLLLNILMICMLYISNTM